MLHPICFIQYTVQALGMQGVAREHQGRRGVLLILSRLTMHYCTGSCRCWKSWKTSRPRECSSSLSVRQQRVVPVLLGRKVGWWGCCLHASFLGLARTIYIRCTYGIFGLEITKYTVYIYVYIRFWPTLIISLACAGFGRQAARYGERIFGSIRDQKYGQLFKLFVGLARNVYIHRIWPNVLWFPCQKYRIYTVYTVLANSSYLRTFSRPEPCD